MHPKMHELCDLLPIMTLAFSTCVRAFSSSVAAKKAGPHRCAGSARRPQVGFSS